jgi:hypothetical protein
MGCGRGGGVERSNDIPNPFHIDRKALRGFLSELAGEEFGVKVSALSVSDFGEAYNDAVAALLQQVCDDGGILHSPPETQMWVQALADDDSIPLLVAITHQQLPDTQLTTLPLDAWALGDLEGRGAGAIGAVLERVCDHANALLRTLRASQLLA